MSDIQKMAGRLEAPELKGDQTLITGFCPVATMLNYSQEILSFTKGRGILRTSFFGYEPCHNAEEVIERAGYDKKHDVENTSDSVFVLMARVLTFPGVRWRNIFIVSKGGIKNGADENFSR